MLRFARQCYKGAKGKVKFTTDIYFAVALALLLVTVQWLGAWILALTMHELCHYIAIRLCGGVVGEVKVSCRGVIMETRSLTLLKEAICVYAGPVGSLFLLVFARYIPRTSICILMLSAYNLLPIFPLDGGRGLGCLLKTFLPPAAVDSILHIIETGVLICGAIIAIYSVFWLGLGLFPAIIVLMLFWRSKGIKTPCKKCRLGLQ